MDPITQFLGGFALLGIPAVVLIPVLVEGAKRLGLPARYAGLAAMLIGMLVAALIGGVEGWPAIRSWPDAPAQPRRLPWRSPGAAVPSCPTRPPRPAWSGRARPRAANR